MSTTTPATTTVAGLGLRTTSELEADHVVAQLAELLRQRGWLDGAGIATHRVLSGEVRHVALSVGWSTTGPSDADLLAALVELADDRAVVVGDRQAGVEGLSAGARVAVAQRAVLGGGRAVRFPGSDDLPLTLTVGELVAVSGIDDVRVLAAGSADPESVIDTRGHVRPLWEDGRLVLLTQPAADGRLVPFESPDPTRCCADHG